MCCLFRIHCSVSYNRWRSREIHLDAQHSLLIAALVFIVLGHVFNALIVFGEFFHVFGIRIESFSSNLNGVVFCIQAMYGQFKLMRSQYSID